MAANQLLVLQYFVRLLVSMPSAESLHFTLVLDCFVAFLNCPFDSSNFCNLAFVVSVFSCRLKIYCVRISSFDAKDFIFIFGVTQAVTLVLTFAVLLGALILRILGA
tara:strand:- start:916 stop:1236 length:321 start_codon:yes stop_codon:yes gene_type:complete